MGKLMPDRGIPGNTLREETSSQRIFFLCKQLFNSPMLISQLYLEMKHLFPVAYEAEMTRFNNPGMNGSNTHFM